MRTLVKLMTDARCAPSTRAACATHILDRAWGKPLQQAQVAIGVGKLSDLTDADLVALLAGPLQEAKQEQLELEAEPDEAELEAEPSADGT
jgi:hypothetical protein